MSVATFRVRAQLDGAGGAKSGTVKIDRETGVVTIRPERSRTTYQATLAEIADLIVKRVLLAGAADQFSPKRTARPKG